MRDHALSRVLTALLSLLFTGLVLVLPPIVSKQLAGAEHTLEMPLVGFIVAAAVFLVSAWRKRFAIAIVAITLIVSAIQTAYYFFTTSASRQAFSLTSSWTELPVADYYRHIVPINTPDVFGYATVELEGSNVTLKLRSKPQSTA